MKSFEEFTSGNLSEAKLRVQEKIEQEILSFLKRKSKPKLLPANELSNFGGSKIVSVIEVRHWGDWEVPDGEYDDGDYDWETLTDKSGNELDKFIKKMSKKSSKLIVEWSQEEKNWIYIIIARV